MINGMPDLSFGPLNYPMTKMSTIMWDSIQDQNKWALPLYSVRFENEDFNIDPDYTIEFDINSNSIVVPKDDFNKIKEVLNLRSTTGKCVRNPNT